MTEWVNQSIKPLSVERLNQALEHQGQLTKPPGSLGRMEELAVLFCGLQDTLSPSLERVAIRVFAADHGVVAEGVSAFPQEVTVEMIRNFANGGAAISVLAEAQGADFAVVNMGTAAPAPEHEKVMQRPLGAGTHNFCEQRAMSPEQLENALKAGYDIAEELHQQQCQLFIGGEMGIGNTTTAAALACALMGESPDKLVGLGTGVDAVGLQRKTEVVARALELHQAAFDNPLACLQCVGGFEIVALTGAYLRCAQRGIPSLVDGFICSVAALAAMQINQACQDWLLFSHQSAEKGHARVLDVLEAEPLLDLNMRLGEGSGAAVALPLLKLACELHNKMATFESAGVSK